MATINPCEGLEITYATEYGTAPNVKLYTTTHDSFTSEDFPILTYDGYEFLGWYDASGIKVLDGTSVWDYQCTYNENTSYYHITIYAKWRNNLGYIIQGITLTNIADKIRALTENESILTTSEMISELEVIAGLIDDEAEVISSIESALTAKGA